MPEEDDRRSARRASTPGDERPIRRNPPRNRFTVPPQVPVAAAKPPIFGVLDPGLFTLAMRVEIETLSPLFTGSGHLEIDGGVAFKAPLERSGRRVLAGASLKGACRQLHEVLTASGDPFRKGAEGASVRLFGSLGEAGRLSFDDAIEAADLPDGAGEARPKVKALEKIRLSTAYQPGKEGMKGRRFYATLPPGIDQPARISAWAFPARVFLATIVRLENATSEEIGSVLTVLGMAPELSFTPRLGGGKYDTYGWVRIRLCSFRRWHRLGRTGVWECDEARVNEFREIHVNRFLTSRPPGLATFRDMVVAKLQGPDRSLP